MFLHDGLIFLASIESRRVLSYRHLHSLEDEFFELSTSSWGGFGPFEIEEEFLFEEIQSYSDRLRVFEGLNVEEDHVVEFRAVRVDSRSEGDVFCVEIIDQGKEVHGEIAVDWVHS